MSDGLPATDNGVAECAASGAGPLNHHIASAARLETWGRKKAGATRCTHKAAADHGVSRAQVKQRWGSTWSTQSFLRNNPTEPAMLVALPELEPEWLEPKAIELKVYR